MSSSRYLHGMGWALLALAVVFHFAPENWWSSDPDATVMFCLGAAVAYWIGAAIVSAIERLRP